MNTGTRLLLGAVLGFHSVAALADMNAKVVCVQGTGESAKSEEVFLLLKDLNDVVLNPNGGFSVKGRGYAFNKELRSERKECRDYYYSAAFSGEDLVATYPRRDWNVLIMKGDGPTILSCGVGSSVKGFEDDASFKVAVGNSRVSGQPSGIALFPGVGYGQETVSHHSCVVQ